MNHCGTSALPFIRETLLVKKEKKLMAQMTSLRQKNQTEFHQTIITLADEAATLSPHRVGKQSG